MTPASRRLPAVSLSRAGGVMALGTVASRATGFLRTIALVAALGSATKLSDAYLVANTTPNILYDLLLGGVLSSAIVPVLVRAQVEDDDAGERLARTLLTVVTPVLALVSLIGVVAAPIIVDVYPAQDRQLAITFVRYFMPQVLFYGLAAAVGAILNVRGRFGAPMLTPVLNNLVTIAAFGAFAILRHGHPGPLTTVQTAVLAGGTTLAVALQALALLPALRACGIRLRPAWAVGHPGLRAALHASGWVFAYAAVNQLGYLVIVRLAYPVAGSYSTYSIAYQLFQLPYAVVSVSILTALMPRLSAAAATGRPRDVIADLSLGLRSTALVLIPATVLLAVLAGPVAVLAFAHGAGSVASAERLGSTFAVLLLGLVPFSGYQLVVRTLYARSEARTAAALNVAVNVVNVAVAALLVALLPGSARAIGLALALTISYATGMAVGLVLLRRRYASLDGPRVLRLHVRVLVASLLAAVPVLLLRGVIRSVAGHGFVASFLVVVVGGGIGAVCYLRLVRTFRVREVAVVERLAGRLLSRVRALRGHPPAPPAPRPRRNPDRPPTDGARRT
ncbi:MAG TPA: murein biosynthesis integral membrane protein MurJ [Frankiaceae bacterium]